MWRPWSSDINNKKGFPGKRNSKYKGPKTEMNVLYFEMVTGCFNEADMLPFSSISNIINIKVSKRYTRIFRGNLEGPILLILNLIHWKNFL